MTSSNRKLFCVTSHLLGEGIHRPMTRWRGALLFCLICAWTNSCANNRYAGGLRHHGDHYDVTVIVSDLGKHRPQIKKSTYPPLPTTLPHPHPHTNTHTHIFPEPYAFRMITSYMQSARKVLTEKILKNHWSIIICKPFSFSPGNW